MKLHDFMRDPALCGEEFADESWAVHREVLARLWDGDGHLIPFELLATAYELLGCEHLPTEPPDELYMAFGRGSGKTRFEAVAAVHAWSQDYRSRGLAPGAWATITCHCPSKKQAGEWLDYCRGFIEKSPMLSEAVSKVTDECIESTHFTKLEVLASNFRAVRGFTMPLAIIDEAAFLHGDFPPCQMLSCAVHFFPHWHACVPRGGSWLPRACIAAPGSCTRCTSAISEGSPHEPLRRVPAGRKHPAQPDIGPQHHRCGVPG